MRAHMRGGEESGVYVCDVCGGLCVMVWQYVTICVADYPRLSETGVHTHLIWTANAE
jgi:hypothetical protein